MPISKDEVRSIDADGPSLPDLAPDTTQGAVYRFLPEHAGRAFRQREIGQQGSVTSDLTDQVTTATISCVDSSKTSDSA